VCPTCKETCAHGLYLCQKCFTVFYYAAYNDDAQGNPEILLGILEDITPAKRKEETLQNYARQLEEQQGQLIEAIKLAEQANILKTQFLANMSHELRTPMHSIITFARQGAERIAKWSLDDHLENLTLIRESGERLLALLNDLLDLSKLEAGAVVYDFVENDLVALAKQATTELNSLAEEKNIILILQPDEAAMPARCDRSKIMQIIINLLSNAIKFTPDGKLVTIRITEDKAPEGYIYLKVIDQGVGIPPDELEKIFDKFIQSSKTRTGAGGTGLGLAICREIAENAKAHALTYFDGRFEDAVQQRVIERIKRATVVD
jgi:signal transduction histidine kinase